MGVGTDLNTHLLDRIVEATRAAGQYGLPGEDLELKLSRFHGKIASPVLSNVELAVEGDVRVAKLHPTPLPDLFQGEQMVVLGRYTGSGPARLVLTGSVAGGRRRFTLAGTFPEREAGRGFLPRLWAMRRVGFILNQIRLHGEHAELRDEAAALARRHGIVTPYTSWLILEDEGRRKVADRDRTLRSFAADGRVRAEAKRMYDAAQAERSGGGAVGDAQAGLGDAGGRAVTVAVERQRTQTVAGRTFFDNGGQWIDARAQERPAARRERVAFASDAYFALLDREPAVAPWLSQGRNVVLLLGDTVYEVGE